MTLRKIQNPKIYFYNVDCLKNFHVIQKYKDVLFALSECKILLSKNAFKFLETEQEIIQALNRVIDYYTAEGLLEKDPNTNKIISHYYEPIPEL
jgi:DNA-binding transcriptional MerR regulator